MTRPEPELRELQWPDIEQALEIEREVFASTAWTREMFWSELAHMPDSRSYLVATRAGRLVGYAGVMMAGGDADVQTVAVAPAERGCGLGRRLLDTVTEDAVQRGCRRIFLEVEATNVAAKGLYEDAGFVVQSRRRDYYGPGSDALVMQRRVSPRRTGDAR